MAMIFIWLFFISAALSAPQPAAAPPPSPPATKTVVTASKGTTKWTETFLATSLSKYSKLSKTTTITTTNTKGDHALVVVYPGGGAWAGVPVPGPLPPIVPVLPIPPPIVPPDQVPPTKGPPTTTTTPKTTTTTTTSSRHIATVTAIMHSAPPDWKSYWGQKPIQVPTDKTDCVTDPKAPTVDADDASKRIDTFCQQKNNQTITVSGIDDDIDLGKGLVLNLTVSLNKVCDNRNELIQLDQGDCGKFLKEAINNCPKGATKNKSGGTVQDYCGIYVAKPQEHDGDLVCSNQADDGVNGDEAKKNIQSFCKKNHNSNISPGQGNSLQFPMLYGSMQQQFSVSYDPSCPHGGSAGYLIDEDACNRFFNRILTECPTKKDKTLFSGKVTDHCGVFSISFQNVEEITCNAPNAVHPMLQKDVVNAINDYSGEDLTLDPNYQSSGSFQQSTPLGQSYDNYFKGLNNYVIRMKAEFTTRPQVVCSPKQKFNTKGDETKRKLNAIITKCGIGKGGFLVDSTPHGCVKWSIAGANTSN